MIAAILITVAVTLYVAVGAALAFLMFNEDDMVRFYGNRYAGAFVLVLAWPIIIGLEV